MMLPYGSRSCSIVAHSVSVVSTIQLHCNKLETFALGQNLKNWKIGKEKFGNIREEKFGNVKDSSIFYVKCLVISRLLDLGGSK